MACLEKKILKDFVTFLPGVNTTRAEKQFGINALNYYDQHSFNADYYHKAVNEVAVTGLSEYHNLSLKKGDIVISNSLHLATMVGASNANKILSLNFTKIELNDEQIDKKYFLYLFNVYKDVRRQKERKLQGSGPILRIPIRTLEELSIPIIPLVEQKRIGTIYAEVLKLQSKLNTYGDLMEEFTNTVLEESLKGGMHK